jgi:hypothetical protein
VIHGFGSRERDQYLPVLIFERQAVPGEKSAPQGYFLRGALAGRRDTEFRR